MKLTDIMKEGDWFIHQTKFGNWEIGQASMVDDNGCISCCLFNRETGQKAEFFGTLKAALAAADKMGLVRTWKIGYHRWKLEAKSA